MSERYERNEQFDNTMLGDLVAYSEVAAGVLRDTQRIVQVVEHALMRFKEDGGHQSVGCKILPILACYPLDDCITEDAMRKMTASGDAPLTMFFPKEMAIHATLDFTMCAALVMMARKMYESIHDDFVKELKTVGSIFEKTVRSATFYEGSNLFERIG